MIVREAAGVATLRFYSASCSVLAGEVQVEAIAWAATEACDGNERKAFSLDPLGSEVVWRCNIGRLLKQHEVAAKGALTHLALMLGLRVTRFTGLDVHQLLHCAARSAWCVWFGVRKSCFSDIVACPAQQMRSCVSR